MSYNKHDAAMNYFYEQISKELYPEHKEQAIDEFIDERMRSYFLEHPEVIQAPFDCFFHASSDLQDSPRSALIMYTTTIELYLKSVLLKPVLYGMIHNENVATLIMESSTGQSGFKRYDKLLTSLCRHAADVELSDIKGLDGRPILVEAGETQAIRNKVIHQGYKATVSEMGKARNVGVKILTKVVEPVLSNLNLVISKDKGGNDIIGNKFTKIELVNPTV